MLVSLPEIQQALNVLNRSTNVLLMVPEKSSADAISSMIALYLKLISDPDRPPDARVDPVSPSHLPVNLQFLDGSSQVIMQPARQPELVLELAGPESLEQVRQEKLSGGLRLHLTFPAGTPLAKDQLETTIKLMPYDSAVVIGAADLEELGVAFARNADFFFNTPVINIDYRAANEHFGTINLVDITASSLAEITFELIARISGPFTPGISTALYSGIVAGTDSFQHPATSPRSFQSAAKLIELKADRVAVIQNLVKTKPLKIIKLAGSMYARLRYLDTAGLYWTHLNASDFHAHGASADDVPAVMRELTNNIANYNAAFLLYEDPAPSKEPPARRPAENSYHVYLLLGRGLQSRQREIQSLLTAAKQNGALVFNLTAPDLAKAEQLTHQKIKQILP